MFIGLGCCGAEGAAGFGFGISMPGILSCCARAGAGKAPSALPATNNVHFTLRLRERRRRNAPPPPTGLLLVMLGVGGRAVGAAFRLFGGIHILAAIGRAVGLHMLA